MTRIRVALFDMAGTTVDDIVEKLGLEEPLPLVIAAYEDAFRIGGIEMPFDELNDCRGKNKLEVFKAKVAKYRGDLSPDEQEYLAQRLHDEQFVPALLENIPYIREMPGTSEAFSYLKDKGVFIATGTGFPKVVADAINEKMGWVEKGIVDYATCKESAGAGRPAPNMINECLVKAGLFSEIAAADLSKIHTDRYGYACVLKIGDTVTDIEEGLGVGATTIAVSSGTQSVEKLVNAGPLVVLPNVLALPQYLENHDYTFQ